MHPFILALQRGLVVQWLGRWTCNSEGCSSTPGHCAAGNKLKQVVDTRASVTKQCKLECGPMPNMMVALPNIGGALYSTLQSLADAHY